MNRPANCDLEACPKFGPRCSPCPQLSTEDNRTPITEGMRVFNYYDGEWGIVTDIREDGWFKVNGTILNGVRVSSVDPQWIKNGQWVGPT